MEWIILILKLFLVFSVAVVLIYAVRHFIFTVHRLTVKQKPSYGDILESELPSVSVIVPMHNEEKVAANVLELLTKVDYPEDKLEIIPINDHSTDKTPEIIDSFAKKYRFIKPLHRNSGKRGKPVSLNDALKMATGEVVIIFDADYLPPKGIIRELAVNFVDPNVGAVMGRVIPLNWRKNLLTRLIDLERCGGYQIDQQARYSLGLIPQYGGTVGGFRKMPVVETGGFDESILAEDTELTFRLYLMGYKVVYANRAECWEEAPESWIVRGRQVRRWSRGHNQVMFRHLLKILKAKNLSFIQKVEGTLLLFVYAFPAVIALGWIDALVLFMLGESNILLYSYLWLMFGVFSGFGNMAPFFQIGVATLIDGIQKRAVLMPFLFLNFFFNTLYITYGFADAVKDVVFKRKREVHWQKTERFREEL